MQAMPNSEPAEGGLAYLRKTQRPNGGFALGFGGVNTQSTAWAVQGMIAVDAAPGSIREGGNSALDYLQARQAADGHYAYSASKDQTPVWVTAQALVAAAGKSFPIAPPARATATSPIPSLESESGSPGVTAPPVSPVETLPLPTPAEGGTEGTASGPGSTPPAATPNGGSTAPGAASPKSGGADSPPPASSSTPQSSFEAAGSDSSPVALIVIGLATASLALGSVVLLGRRYSW